MIRGTSCLPHRSFDVKLHLLPHERPHLERRTESTRIASYTRSGSCLSLAFSSRHVKGDEGVVQFAFLAEQRGSPLVIKVCQPSHRRWRLLD